MPIKSSQTIADRLNAAQLAINNTLTDSEIESLVAAYGYNEVRMNEGKQRYDQALSPFVRKHKRPDCWRTWAFIIHFIQSKWEEL